MIAVVLAGCSAPRVNTTRLTAADLVAMTDAMAASLANDADLAGRRGDWIIATDRVVNHTNDIITAGEKAAFLARLRALLNEARLPGVAFVREADQSGPDRLRPTHALTATFYALTDDSRIARSDAYVCAFQLLDLATDAVVWEDRYEVKRRIVRDKLD